MGIMTTDDDGHVDSIVFFLAEALRAAIENGDSVERGLLEAPKLSPNMSCGEIADRLAAYRRHQRAVWSYEVLMVAKIMRARELARELRAMETEFRPELDTFRLATVSCADLKELLIPNVQNQFNGVDHGRRLTDEFGGSFGGAKADPLAGYRIAGHTDIRLLLSACEDLHFALAARYAFDPLPVRTFSEIAAEDEEEPLLLEETADENEDAFLLTDFCEIVSESPAPVGMEWHGQFVGNPARPN